MSALPALKATPGPYPHSEEWESLRLFDPNRKDHPVLIGASDAASACNVSKYGSALQLYLEKRGEMTRPPETEESKERRAMGQMLESVILDIYSIYGKCQVTKNLPMYLSDGHWFMSATPDAFGRSEGSEELWNVDAKNSNWRMFDTTGEDEHKFGREGTDEVPLYILYQAQHQMEVLGLDRVDIPVLQNGNSLKVYTITRSIDLIASIVSAEKELAERICAGDPPEPNWEHAETRRIINEMFGVQVGEVRELNEDHRDLWLRREELSKQKKEIETEYDAITNMLLFDAGEAEILRFPHTEFEIKRSVIADTIVSEKDVESLRARIGQVLRRGHARLTRRKLSK